MSSLQRIGIALSSLGTFLIITAVYPTLSFNFILKKKLVALQLPNLLNTGAFRMTIPQVRTFILIMAQ